MEKIRTALGGSFGQTVSTGAGAIKFDNEGLAEVTAEQAEFLMGNFPNVYYKDGEEKPTPNSGTHTPAEKDPAVAEFARNHTKQKDMERTGAPAKIERSSSQETTKLVDAQGNEISSKEDSTEEVDAEEPAEEPAEEAPLDEETVAMLEKLSVKDIHATLKSAGVQDEETAKIKSKKKLVPIAARKLT